MTDTWISSEDIRQFLYCKRKIYWRNIAKFKQFSTNLMDKGLDFHKSKLKQQIRSQNIEYREYYLLDETEKLTGIADRIIIKNNTISVIEHKNLYELDYIVYNNKMQLLFLAKLASKHFGMPVRNIEIRTNFGKKVKLDITNNDFEEVKMIINEIRELYRKQMMPEPTDNPRQCNPCEYRNICFR